MATIPIHLEDSDLKKIDYLIKTGRFKNRSQVIKIMLRSKLDQEGFPLEWENEDQERQRQHILQQLLPRKDIQIQWRTGKNSVEQVRESRDR